MSAAAAAVATFRRTGRRADRGSVMVITLVVLAGLVLLMATLAANERAAVQATQDQLRHRRATLAAQAAVARTLSDIQQATTTSVTLNDVWALDGDNGNTVFDIGDGTTKFRMQIVDACSMINVNAAGGTSSAIGPTTAQANLVRQEIQQLPLTQQQQDSLLDWITTGQQPRANGAKDSYYNGLTVPYYSKLGRLNSIDDLMLVQGWTADTLYSTQPNNIVSSGVTLQDANGNPLPLIDVLTVDGAYPLTGRQRLSAALLRRLAPNLSAAQANQLAAATSFSTLLRSPQLQGNPSLIQTLLNTVKFTNVNRQEGKININTAPAAVLETIPGLTPDIASTIVSQQTNGFTSLGALATTAGLSGTRLAEVADAVGVGSDTWIVRAYGESGGVGVAVEAVIGMRTPQASGTTAPSSTAAQARVLTWNVLPGSAVPAWWSWPDQPTGTANAGDSQTANTGVSS